MKKHTFVVIAYAPEGVLPAEIADHLADASRSMSQEYAASDPLSGMPDIEVYGTLPRSELVASSTSGHEKPLLSMPALG